MLLALAVVIVHAFRPVVIRLYVAYLFCLVFSKKFNIMSALSAHQAHTYLAAKNRFSRRLF